MAFSKLYISSNIEMYDNIVKKARETFYNDRLRRKPNLFVVVIGHVDTGKSTLVGHLLFKLGYVNKNLIHKYKQDSKKIGKPSFHFAWVMDDENEERNRGVTMDTGVCRFEMTDKKVTMFDAPGHKDFIPNMITGAIQSDAALLVVDATYGEFETGFGEGGQTREHAVLIRSLGISQIVVVINKIDNISWSKERVVEVTGEVHKFLIKIGFKDNGIIFVPCSGFLAENLIEKPKENEFKKWYTGLTVLDAISRFECPRRNIAKPLRMSINDIFVKSANGICVSGRIDYGMVQVGDKVLVQPTGCIVIVKAITIDNEEEKTAFAGDSASITLGNYDSQNIAAGHVLCDPVFSIPVTSKFEAKIVIFNTPQSIIMGYPVMLHAHNIEVSAVITHLVALLNKNTGEVMKNQPRLLTKNSSAIIVLETTRPIAVELYKDIKCLSRILLRNEGSTIAAGLVTLMY